MKNLIDVKPADSITASQKKFLDSLFYRSIQNNPLADRLRRCPGCGLYHFVEHRSSDYHNGKCADDHFNLKRTLDAHALKAGATESNMEAVVIGDEKALNQKPATDKLILLEPLPEKVIDMAIQIKNQEMLKRLLGNDSEAIISPNDLFSTGFDETAYDVRVKFPGSELNFCVYDEYCLSWQDIDVIVINLLKDMLWAYM